MKTDSQLFNEINEKLSNDPEINAANVAIAIHEGIITLGGSVSKYSEKLAAERAIKSIGGVKGIVDEIKVNLSSLYSRQDIEIAKAAVSALAWNINVPAEAVKVIVDNGWLTLTGEVKWYYQKQAAESAVRYLYGVRGISNNIIVKPSVTPFEVRNKILREFERNAQIDANNVSVEVEGSKVTLRGHVKNLTEMKVASKAAWSTSGVSEVHNYLEID